MQLNQGMDYNYRQFMIFSVTELPNVNFNEVLETSTDSVRRSADGTKTLVKWDGELVPSSIDSLTTKEGPYTYSEVYDILLTEFWVGTASMM
jgi:hypothetical protein